MTETAELYSLSSGSAATNSPRARNRRVNPVCLELPVTIQALAGAGRTPEAQSDPIDCATVIVFENGAVLRLYPGLPEGQPVQVCNALGREARGRVVPTLNRDKLRSFVEIEFSEPIHDFWGVHQLVAPASDKTSPALDRAMAQPAQESAGDRQTEAPAPVPENTRPRKALSAADLAVMPKLSTPRPAAPVQRASARAQRSLVGGSLLSADVTVALRPGFKSASKFKSSGKLARARSGKVIRILSAMAMLLVVAGAGAYLVAREGSMLREFLPASLQPKPMVHAVAPARYHSAALPPHSAQSVAHMTPPPAAQTDSSAPLSTSRVQQAAPKSLNSVSNSAE